MKTRQIEQPPSSPAGDAHARGFSAELRGVSLWDFVQMECLARSRSVVEIIGAPGEAGRAGERRLGYLYFDGGRIVHATTARNVGEPAALEILSWNGGSLRPRERAWPRRPTIFASHEALLLEAAKRRDEASGSNLVAFPGAAAPAIEQKPPEGSTGGDEMTVIELSEQGSGNMKSSKTMEEAPPPSSGERAVQKNSGDAEIAGDFSALLRLGPSGAIITRRGASEELAETVAYAHRLVELAGELMGLEQFVALECVFSRGRCLIFTEDGGELVALRPRPEANLQPLRERLGL